jgi:Uma2 family endonuclease
MIKVGAAALAQGADVAQEPGIVWEDDGEDNVSPDFVISFTPPPAPGQKLRRCPEIVVEVLSAGEENRRRDTEAKRELYWRRGAREYWIVDPDARSVTRLTRGSDGWQAQVLRDSDVLVTPLIAAWPGLAVADLFA